MTDDVHEEISDSEGEDMFEPSDYYSILDDMSKKWMSVHLSHNVSLAATYEFWNLAVKMIPKLIAAKERQDVVKNIPQFVHLRRKLYREMCPPVQLEIQYLKKSTNETINVNCQTTPVKLYSSNPDYIKQCEIASIKVSN